MCSESIKQRIADLRGRANQQNIAARRSGRYHDYFQHHRNEMKLKAEANELEQQLKQAGES